MPPYQEGNRQWSYDRSALLMDLQTDRNPLVPATQGCRLYFPITIPEAIANSPYTGESCAYLSSTTRRTSSLLLAISFIYTNEDLLQLVLGSFTLTIVELCNLNVAKCSLLYLFLAT